VTFKEKTQGISFSMAVSCPSSGAWTFSGKIYAGTYDVTVSGYYSEIPSTSFLAKTGLAVSGAVANLVLDVKAYDVTGTVTLNGATPQPSSCSYSSGATVTFKEKTQGISFSMAVSCPSAGAWAFSGKIYAGTYDVTVTGYYSEIPSTSFLARTGLAVSGAVANLVLDVKAYDVAGTVTLNGATPQPSSCSYSSGATVTFKEKTQGISFSMAVSCPSSGAWSFSGRVYAGTYDVTVTGYYSEIPSTPFLALTALRIP
jgi:hypothetical protein